MPPQRALASLGFVAPAVLPLPSAAPGQDNPGAVTSHGSCSWAPPGAAASAGEGQEGGGRSGTVPGRGSALQGLSVAALGGPGHTHRTPSASLGRKQEQQISSPGCSRGPQAAQLLGDSSVQGLLLALPSGCGTRRDKHRDKLGDTRGGPVLAQLPRAGPSGNKRIPGVPSSRRAAEDPAVAPQPLRRCPSAALAGYLWVTLPGGTTQGPARAPSAAAGWERRPCGDSQAWGQRGSPGEELEPTE